MTVTTRPAPGDPGYRALGLVADPFQVPPASPDDADPVGVRLAIHHAAVRLLAALDAVAGQDHTQPILIEKDGAIPRYYHLGALAEVMEVLSEGDGIGVLIVYIPLDMLALGRVRSALSSLSEHVANATFDLTLAAYVRGALEAPDASLPEWESVREHVPVFLAALADDAREALAGVYGVCEPEREGSDDTETLMRVSSLRQDRLETDPLEDDTLPEDLVDDPLAEALAGETADRELVSGPTPADLIAAYVAAHIKEHLSPVVARAVRAYRSRGTSAVAQELKITKAPKKTLAALVRFATARYRRVALLYDRFDMWTTMPQDLRSKVVGTLSELRWSLADAGGSIVLSLSPGQAPEVEEQFAASVRVAWDFAELESIEGADPRYDAGVVGAWLADGTIPGAKSLAGSPELERLAAACGGSLEVFVRMASAAIGDAAQRRVGRIDGAAVDAGLAVRDG
ncbi:MAG: hypothetical protein WC971_03220 [Coriobacteriia bacterium]